MSLYKLPSEDGLPSKSVFIRRVDQIENAHSNMQERQLLEDVRNKCKWVKKSLLRDLVLGNNVFVRTILMWNGFTTVISSVVSRNCCWKSTYILSNRRKFVQIYCFTLPTWTTGLVLHLWCIVSSIVGSTTWQKSLRCCGSYNSAYATPDAYVCMVENQTFKLPCEFDLFSCDLACSGL